MGLLPVQGVKAGSFSGSSLTRAEVTQLLRRSRRPTVARGAKPVRAKVYRHTNLVQLCRGLLTTAWIRSHIDIRWRRA